MDPPCSAAWLRSFADRRSVRICPVCGGRCASGRDPSPGPVGRPPVGPSADLWWLESTPFGYRAQVPAGCPRRSEHRRRIEERRSGETPTLSDSPRGHRRRSPSMGPENRPGRPAFTRGCGGPGTLSGAPVHPKRCAQEGFGTVPGALCGLAGGALRKAVPDADRVGASPGGAAPGSPAGAVPCLHVHEHAVRSPLLHR